MDKNTLLEFLNKPIIEIIAIANRLRKDNCGDRLHLCSIINARSGLCSGDCAYCAQSAVSKADIPVYPMKSKEEILKHAKRMKEIGAQRFSIVTSGESLGDGELEVVLEALPEIKALGLGTCASLGILDRDRLHLLKEAGLERYHHNIESSPRYYSKIVSTHNFEDRIKTLRLAKEVGLEVCSGVIIGMGEDWQDRVDMAFILSELGVDSVPVNLFIPIEGTPLESVRMITPEDAIRTMGMFRFAMPDKEIRLIAGRELVFAEDELIPFMSGANGMMIGGYLTRGGNLPDRDRKLIEDVLRAWASERMDDGGK